jgi:hypothetical protein
MPSRRRLLRSRGMLDETVVYWTTEFGRMPCSQGSKGPDHNPFAFTTRQRSAGLTVTTFTRRF